MITQNPALLQKYKQLFEHSTEIKAIFDSHGNMLWPKTIGANYKEPFWVENTTSETATLSLNSGSSAPYVELEGSTDKTNWQVIGDSSSTWTYSIPAHSKLYLRSSADAWGSSTYVYVSFNGTFTKCGGNIMSLTYGSNFTGNERTFKNNATYVFCGLFYANTYLEDASELLLPATTLSTYCYSQMFYGCTSLTAAPALPATTLATYCYNRMFYGCTSLTTAPELPATTLANDCYNSMFYGCTSLTTAPALPATTLATWCYLEMFRGCTSLTTAPSLPATTVVERCYYNMFYGCTSLTTAPSLPATTLVNRCYYGMFQLCTSLTTAPELQATTLVNSCYSNMFNGCTLLNHIVCLATSGIAQNNSTTNWVNGVSATGTFVKAAGASWPEGTYGIPSGWTVVEE